jgi:mycofactocin glycosyltransferase
MPRPTVDVVVPYLGPPAGLAELSSRLARLRLAPGDTLTVVDNHPDARADAGRGQRRVITARRLQTPGHARNTGAAEGDAQWLVFLDADTRPPPDLLDAYFSDPPGPATALLAGGISDEPAEQEGRPPPAVRWAQLTRSMSQDTTLGLGRWGFAQTANCAVRRDAFAAVGGFREELRACEDADLCYRLEAAGWTIERREEARVVHAGRRTLRELLGQQLVHGAGIGWLEREYPGAAPAHRWPGFLLWGIRRAVTGLAAAARGRDRDTALVAILDPVVAWTRELGRSRSNTRTAAG